MDRRFIRLERVGLVGLTALIFVGGLMGGRLLRRTAPAHVQGVQSTTSEDAPSWEEVIRPHPQFLLVYIGRSNCAWCNDARVPGLWAAFRDSILKVVEEYDSDVVEVGFAIDRDLRAGADHLDKIGTFDQVSIGGGWGNVGVLNWIIDRYGGPYSTPQVLLLVRWWTYSGVPPALKNGEQQRLLARLSGLYDLSSVELQQRVIRAVRDVLNAEAANQDLGSDSPDGRSNHD